MKQFHLGSSKIQTEDNPARNALRHGLQDMNPQKIDLLYFKPQTQAPSGFIKFHLDLMLTCVYLLP